MADSDDKDQKQPAEEDQETGRQSVILGLAEQLLAEADNLAREVKEDAEREAEARAATVVGEAERRAADIVSAASENAKRIQSQAHAAVRKLSKSVTAELESSVSALEKLMVADGEADIGATPPTQGMGHTLVEEEDAPERPNPPRLQGYDVHSLSSRGSKGNGR